VCKEKNQSSTTNFLKNLFSESSLQKLCFLLVLLVFLMCFCTFWNIMIGFFSFLGFSEGLFS